MKRILSVANFRRKMGYPSFKELRRLQGLGYINIQQSGFKADSLHHHKIVCINDLKKVKEILLNEHPRRQTLNFDETTTPKFADKDKNKVLVWIRPDIQKELVAITRRIYVRDVPRDLYKRLKAKQEMLDCNTWVTFLFEVDRILKKHIEEEKGMLVE